MGHSPRIGLDQNGEITSYYLAKIAAQRSEKIKKYAVQVEEIKQLQTKKPKDSEKKDNEPLKPGNLMRDIVNLNKDSTPLITN